MNTITTPPFLRKASTYLIATFLVCFSSMLFTQQANAQNPPACPSDPIEIDSFSDFLAGGDLREYAISGCNFLQTNNIDAADNSPRLGGIPSFNGQYDGNGYEIRNLNLGGRGIFDEMTNARFENVSIINVDQQVDSNNSGIIAGSAANKTVITNVYVQGVLLRVQNNGENHGGFVGVLSGAVDDEGFPDPDEDDPTTASIISNSFSSVTVSGGLDNIGGVVGQVDNGTITNVYALAPVSYEAGANAGPVVGIVGGNGGTFNNVYYNTETTSFASSYTPPTGISGLSTSQMKLENSFTGWDFANTWTIYENVSFPTLSIFSEPVAAGEQERTPLPLYAGPNIVHDSDAGGSAWRHFGSVLNLTYSDMLSSLFESDNYTDPGNTGGFVNRPADENRAFRLWTQGFAGAETANGTANVQIWDNDANDNNPNFAGSGNFVPLDNDGVTSLTSDISAGDAFTMFVFKEQVDGADNSATEGTGSFPKYPLYRGQPFDQTVDITAVTNQSADSWSFFANSYLVPVDVDQIDATGGVSTTVTLWDPAANAHIQSSIGTGVPEDLTDFDSIAPFQGILMQNTSSVTTPSITIPVGARITDGTGNEEGLHNLNGEELVMGLNIQASVVDSPLRSSAYVTFSDFSFDNGPKLLPSGGTGFVELALEGNSSHLLHSRHFPLENSGVVEVPVSVNYFEAADGEWVNAGNTVNLSWRALDSFNSDWEISLLDTETGVLTNMRDVSSIEVELQGNSNKKIEGINFDNPMEIRTRTADKNFESRFVLQIEPGTLTSTPSNSNLPEQISLNQNYPNPFNPTTNIEYSLNEASDVTLEVYNMTGQRVAILENGSQSAGTHTVSFDASSLSSGVYVYRLQAGSTVLTRKMTLIK